MPSSRLEEDVPASCFGGVMPLLASCLDAAAPSLPAFSGEKSSMRSTSALLKASERLNASMMSPELPAAPSDGERRRRSEVNQMVVAPSLSHPAVLPVFALSSKFAWTWISVPAPFPEAALPPACAPLSPTSAPPPSHAGAPSHAAAPLDAGFSVVVHSARPNVPVSLRDPRRACP